MEAFNILIVLATFLGPISAVLVTRWVDKQRERRQQQMYVFRTLMRTRKMPVNLDHVRALNLVEVEFYKYPSVTDIFRELIKHYTENYGEDKSVDQIKLANEKADRIKARILSEMSKVLGYKYGEIDLFEGGYVPRAWVDEVGEQQAIRRGVMQILAGNSPLQVAPFASPPVTQPNSPLTAFPPKPD